LIYSLFHIANIHKIFDNSAFGIDKKWKKQCFARHKGKKRASDESEAPLSCDEDV
jgi:hypothetical protein